MREIKLIFPVEIIKEDGKVYLLCADGRKVPDLTQEEYEELNKKYFIEITSNAK